MLNFWWKFWIINYCRHDYNKAYYFAANDQADKELKGDASIQPEMKALKEKYSSKDQKTQQKLQQETMAIISKA